MPQETEYLKLKLTDMETDGDDLFDFDDDLNKNFKKIDEYAKNSELSGLYYTKIKDIKVVIPSDETTYKSVDIDYYTTRQLD